MPIYRWVRMLLPIVPLVCSGSQGRGAIALRHQDLRIIRNPEQYSRRVHPSVHPSGLTLNGGELHRDGDGHGLHHDDGHRGYGP
jgi:hypothetical protein